MPTQSKFQKTDLHVTFRSVFYLCLLFAYSFFSFQSALAGEVCPTHKIDKHAIVKMVYDGDTIRLAN
ncbi:MAG: hypothetical protein R3240_02430, partial [Gammaproteobacteria bacterium]|nr:hypothetical protein [Gammaproteobacteria bacterium]